MENSIIFFFKTTPFRLGLVWFISVFWTTLFTLFKSNFWKYLRITGSKEADLPDNRIFSENSLVLKNPDKISTGPGLRKAVLVNSSKELEKETRGFKSARSVICESLKSVR